MAKKSMLFVLLAFVLLFSATAVLADQDGTACWCNIDEYGCYNLVDGAKEYLMFWSQDAATLFMGPDSGAIVTPRPAGDKLAMKGPFIFDYGYKIPTGITEDGSLTWRDWSSDTWSCKQSSKYFPGGWTCSQ